MYLQRKAFFSTCVICKSLLIDMNKIRVIKQLRWIGITEGVSFMVLLLIAMPIKYIYGNPLPVKYTGWAHGGLFVLYIYAVLQATWVLKWEFSKMTKFVVASFIPLATFFLDANLKKEQNSTQP